VNSVAYSPDGNASASGSEDNTVKVWDVEKGQEVLSLKGHTTSVTSVTYSPDGKRISGKDDFGKVLTWDAPTGQLLPEARPVPIPKQTEATSPNGTQRASIDNKQIQVVVVEVQKRQQALDRAFLERLSRPDPEYHRHKADLYEKSSDIFAVAFICAVCCSSTRRTATCESASLPSRASSMHRRKPTRRCHRNSRRRCRMHAERRKAFRSLARATAKVGLSERLSREGGNERFDGEWWSPVSLQGIARRGGTWQNDCGCRRPIHSPGG